MTTMRKDAVCIDKESFSRFFRLLATIWVSLSLAACAEARPQMIQLDLAGEKREYKVHVPDHLGDKPAPIVMVLHGGLGSAEETEETTGMSSLADRHNFIAVYPNGIGGRLGKMKNHRTWNAGACCGRAARENVDDVNFLANVIADVISRFSGDPKRVYITGISNGAMMAYRMACERPALVTAIAPVAGTLAISKCNGADHIPILAIHGSDDSNVPLEGGEGENSISGVKHRSVLESVQMIASARGCLSLDKRAANDSDVYEFKCSSDPVELRVIRGGEHVWPGGKSRRNQKLDRSNFSGSEAVWQFMSRYSK